MISSKTKGLMFADDDNLSKLKSPENFLFADTPEIQSMFVHLSRTNAKMRRKTTMGGKVNPPAANVSMGSLSNPPLPTTGVKHTRQRVNNTPQQGPFSPLRVALRRYELMVKNSRRREVGSTSCERRGRKQRRYQSPPTWGTTLCPPLALPLLLSP